MNVNVFLCKVSCVTCCQFLAKSKVEVLSPGCWDKSNHLLVTDQLLTSRTLFKAALTSRTISLTDTDQLLREEMETFLSFLLLICSVSATQLNTESDSEIMGLLLQTEPKGEETAKTLNNQQSDTPDIHAVLKYEIRDLQRENEVKKVAFSASLLTSGSGHTGPFNTETPVVFRHALTNIGKAYNPDTGFFSAPVRGVYHFEIHIHGLGHETHPSSAYLVRNGQNVVLAYEHQSSGHVKSSNGVTLLLEVGDIVFVRLSRNSRIFDNVNHNTVFSGHLVFTM
uniref:C1q domain-containing protein n=1 Tax=Salarias fasciatus TaxID=181472 RepID=A0A672FXV4_SALFA